MQEKYIVSAHISWQFLLDKLYIVDERTQHMYVLEDEVSKRLWNEICAGKNIKEVIKNLSLEYKVEEKIIERDCLEWLEEMKKIEVLEGGV